MDQDDSKELAVLKSQFEGHKEQIKEDLASIKTTQKEDYDRLRATQKEHGKAIEKHNRWVWLVSVIGGLLFALDSGPVRKIVEFFMEN